MASRAAGRTDSEEKGVAIKDKQLDKQARAGKLRTRPSSERHCE